MPVTVKFVAWGYGMTTLSKTSIRTDEILHPGAMPMLTTSHCHYADSIPYPVEICRVRCRYIKTKNVPKYQSLFPSEQLLSDYLAHKAKGTNIPPEEYKRRYYDETLSSLDPTTVYNDIVQRYGEHATLICRCGDYSRCHRRLVAEWLFSATGHEVRELAFNSPDRTPWTPKFILIHNDVENDFISTNAIINCKDATVAFTGSGNSEDIKRYFNSYYDVSSPMVSNINAGKELLYISPLGKAVDVFEMPDERLNCPEFCKINFAPNGCYYRCEWCFLKATYREMRPFITIRAEHNALKEQIKSYLRKVRKPIMFNSGEMSDSLALEHLSMFGREFIPWFGAMKHSHLFMLTKSDNIDYILDLPHRGYTTIAWSMNEPSVSALFEVGAPTFERRLKAAGKVHEAGYPVRIRIDPIVPISNWEALYSKMIKKVFETINPERVTIGTLRFEDAFFKNKNNYLLPNSNLFEHLQHMTPMLDRAEIDDHGKKKVSVGKISFPESVRIQIFDFVVKEIRKHQPQIQIALCKETSPVWRAVGLNPDKIQCACQLA